MSSAAFLDSLFAGKPEDMLISLWTKQDLRSYWAESASEALGLVNALSPAGCDIYFGVGLARNDARERSGHLSSAEVAAITCLWVDIDIGDLGHSSGKSYPPDTGSIDAILVAGGIEPSAIVHSGHGVHAYFLLDQPWIFRDDGDRRCAATLVKGFQNHLRQCARLQGYDIDSTHDLARLLRVPDTTNRKDPGNPVPVTMLKLDPDRRYSIKHLKEVFMNDKTEPNLPTDAAQVADQQTTRPGSQPGLRLDSDVQIPLPRLAELTTQDAQFLQTWQHARQDLKSDSEYDQAIAVAALRRGWGEQDTLDLLVAHRRERATVPGKTDDKLQRLDYFEKTIRSAVDFITDNGLESTKDLEQQAVAIMEAVRGGNKYPSDTERTVLLRYLSRMFEVKVLDMVQYGREGSYVMVLDGDIEMEFSKPDELLSKAKFMNRLVGTVGYEPQIDAESWLKIRAMLPKACRVDHEGIGGRLQRHAEWIGDYIADTDIADDLEEVISARYLYRDAGGKVYLYKPNLLKWIIDRRGQRVSDNEITVSLKRLGFTSVEKQQRPIKKCLWLLPPAYVPTVSPSSMAAA